MKEKEEIIKKIVETLPYKKPFLFVSEIITLSDDIIEGSFEFSSNSSLYDGHFVGYPVIPGVLLFETMGQIGLVCFGSYLLKLYESSNQYYPWLTYLEADLRKPVFPGDKVFVHSEKIALKKNYLKCRIFLYDNNDNLVITSIASCSFSIR